MWHNTDCHSGSPALRRPSRYRSNNAWSLKGTLSLSPWMEVRGLILRISATLRYVRFWLKADVKPGQNGKSSAENLSIVE